MPFQFTSRISKLIVKLGPVDMAAADQADEKKWLIWCQLAELLAMCEQRHEIRCAADRSESVHPIDQPCRMVAAGEQLT